MGEHDGVGEYHREMTPAVDPGTLSCAECRRPYSADDLARFGIVLICSECKDRYVQKLREGCAGRGPGELRGLLDPLCSVDD
jgi:hypothetical protein